MASPVPAKTQPLHNFSLPHHLQWKNHRPTTTSRSSRLTGETSSSSPPHRSPSPVLRQSSPLPYRKPSPLHKQSPIRDSESESEKNNKFYKPADDSIQRKRSSNSNNNKICIRIRKDKNDVVPEENENVNEVVATSAMDGEDESLIPKTWNLRPRRPPMNHKQFNGGLTKIRGSLTENRSLNNNKEVVLTDVKVNDNVTVKKQKFSIGLTREEIEEDIFSLTGLKPSRRPKKRPRSVQKQLDTLFPGLWLGSITADSYKVSEALPK